jgi:hypothetical protein
MDVDCAEFTSSERESEESINMDFEHANHTNSADKAESKSINMNHTTTPKENHDADESKSESESKNDAKSNFQHVKHTSYTAEEESDQETLESPDDPPMLVPGRAETPSLVLQDQDQSPPRTPPRTLAASAATEAKDQIAKQGKQPGGSASVAVPKRTWRPKVELRC